jgi:copper homeostasis protein
LIRPRPGGFVYGDDPFLTMRRDADLALAHGADGLVFGLLRSDHSIDRPRTSALVAQAGRRQTVFHRAFDLTPDPFAALETLIDLGVTRVLTSGQQPAAPDGADLIRRLIERAAGRIEILPGAGVTPANAAALIARTGATQLHGTFSVPRANPAGPVCDGGYRATSAQLIADTRTALRAAP